VLHIILSVGKLLLDVWRRTDGCLECTYQILVEMPMSTTNSMLRTTSAKASRRPADDKAVFHLLGTKGFVFEQVKPLCRLGQSGARRRVSIGGLPYGSARIPRARIL